jgi:hypothetical protein
LDGILPISGLAHYFNAIFLGREQSAKPFAHDGVVINYQNPDLIIHFVFP